MSNTEISFVVRVLPEATTYAEDMGDIFVPDDVNPGEVLVRKGMIKRISTGKYGPVAIAYYRPLDEKERSLFAAYVEEHGKWELAIGYGGKTPIQLKAAFTTVGVVIDD